MNRFWQSHVYQLLALALLWLLFGIFIVKPWQLYFLNDDFMHIPDARIVLRSGFMRPVPNVFVWFDKALYGSSPLGFFITSIFLHGLAVFSAYFLTDALQGKLKLITHLKELPFWTALFFLVLPFHAESIMWTIARVSIMATAFTLFSLACFIKADNLNKTFWASWVWLLLALFSYESMWNVVPIYLLVGWYKVNKRIIRRRMAFYQCGAMVATFGAYLFIRLWLLHSIVGDGYDNMEANVKNIPLLIGNLFKLIARIYTPAINNTNVFLLVVGVFTLMLFFATYRHLKANRNTGIFLIIIWVAMATGVATAAPLGIDTHFHESDRYTYYASFFLCLLLAILCQSLASEKANHLISALLFIGFTIGFYVLQRHYAFSSSVTRGTVQFVNKQPVASRLIFIDVPERYKGALIYRTSLPNAIEWLGPKTDTVIIYSQTRSFEREGDFKTGTMSMDSLKAAKGGQFMLELNDYLNRQQGSKGYSVLWYGKGGLWLLGQ